MHSHKNTVILSMSMQDEQAVSDLLDLSWSACVSVLMPKHQFFKLWFFTAGYYGDGLNAIIVFAVCFMPESNQPNYRYIMDNLFKWVFIRIPLASRAKYFPTSANGIFPSQVCHRHTWALGCWELYDCVFEWGNLSEKDANCRLAPKVLSADW